MIINSLGSQYSFSFVRQSLAELVRFIASYCIDIVGFDLDRWTPLQEIHDRFQKEFAGTTTILTYKGRDALEFALQAHGIGRQPGDAVLTQAFTRFALEEGITRAGAQTVYVDIDSETLNPSLVTIRAAYQRATKKSLRPRAVILQYTLGYTIAEDELHAIVAWCKEHSIILIEDLAQSYGAHYLGTSQSQLLPVGALGSVVILSFGRDKVVDGISGGLVVFKESPLQPLPQLRKLSPSIVIRDLLYPVLGWSIRRTLRIGLGKLLHRIAQKTGLMTNPIASPSDHATHLPAPYARLINLQLHQLGQFSLDRRARSFGYHEKLSPLFGSGDGRLRSLVTQEQIEASSNLRYSLWVDDPYNFLKFMNRHGVSIHDRWYRSAVDIGSLDLATVYEAGSCPQAEELAQHCVNLPTHSEISEKDQAYLCALCERYQRGEGI